MARPFGSYTKIIPTRINGKRTKTYNAYMGMIQRCTNPNSHIWKYYGGRGIKVCDRWLGKPGFDNFVTDLGQAPAGMTLDRYPDNNGNYEPSNCRWATPKQQAQTRRKGGPINPNSLRQQALKAGLPYSCLYQRVKLHNWPLHQALSTPHLGHGKPEGGWVRTNTKTS